MIIEKCRLLKDILILIKIKRRCKVQTVKGDNCNM